MEEEIYKEVINILNKCVLGDIKYHYARPCKRIVEIIDEKDKDNYVVTIALHEKDFREEPNLEITGDGFYGYRLVLSEVELIETSYLFNLLASKSEKELLVDLQKITNGI